MVSLFPFDFCLFRPFSEQEPTVKGQGETYLLMCALILQEGSHLCWCDGECWDGGPAQDGVPLLSLIALPPLLITPNMPAIHFHKLAQ
jgi:hypothetical protein